MSDLNRTDFDPEASKSFIVTALALFVGACGGAVAGYFFRKRNEMKDLSKVIEFMLDEGMIEPGKGGRDDDTTIH